MSEYLIVGTNVLKNKLGHVDQKSLNAGESEISMEALLTNISSIRNLSACNLESLNKIHYIMFNQIYEWAGEYRTENISKGSKLFHPVEKFAEAINAISTELSSSLNFSKIMNIYNDINHLHPFREGNGRSTRVWINLLLEQTLKMQINWSTITPKVYMNAMRADDAKKLEKAFEPHLIKVDSKNYASSFLTHNIASYAYEDEYFSDDQYNKMKKIIESWKDEN